MSEKRTFNRTEAAERIGVSAVTLWRWERDGLLEPTGLVARTRNRPAHGRRYRYTSEDIERIRKWKDAT